MKYCYLILKQFFALSVLFLGVSLFFSCSKSPEEKAQSFLKEYISEYLQEPSTYAPVETVCDSLYNNVFLDKSVRERTVEYIALKKAARDIEIDENNTKYALNRAGANNGLYQIVPTNMRGAYENQQLEKSSQNILRLQKKLKSLAEDKIKNAEMQAECLKYIKDKYETLSKDTFVGWQIHLKYRFASSTGHEVRRNSLFFLDQNMEHLLMDEINLDYNGHPLMEILTTLESILDVENLIER